jgi:hypothetical protein
LWVSKESENRGAGFLLEVDKHKKALLLVEGKGVNTLNYKL